jgi:hypothetical protein
LMLLRWQFLRVKECNTQLSYIAEQKSLRETVKQILSGFVPFQLILMKKLFLINKCKIYVSIISADF